MATRLEGLVLKELSLVDRPANKEAMVTIVKRDSGSAVDSIMKCMATDEGATMFSDAMRSNEIRRSRWEAWEKLYPMMDALSESVRSIVGSVDIDTAAKQMMLRSSVEQFMASVIGAIPEAEEELEKFAVALVKGEINHVPGDPNMPTVEELQKSVEALTKSLAMATALAKMSDAEKEYMNGMDEEAKKEFMALSPEDRKQKMAVSKAADATIEVNGTVIKRSVVGTDMFAVLKAQQDQLAEIQKAATKAKEEAEHATLAKRATEEFAHLPGGTEAATTLLKAASGMTDEAKAALDALMKSAEEMAKGNFKPVGKSAGGSGEGKSATEQLDDLAKAYASEHNVSFAKAYSEVISSNPNLYQETLTGSN